MRGCGGAVAGTREAGLLRLRVKPGFSLAMLCPVGAMIGMRIRDYYPQGKR